MKRAEFYKEKIRKNEIDSYQKFIEKAEKEHESILISIEEALEYGAKRVYLIYSNEYRHGLSKSSIADIIQVLCYYGYYVVGRNDIEDSSFLFITPIRPVVESKWQGEYP